jgi:hypothetical protein
MNVGATGARRIGVGDDAGTAGAGQTWTWTLPAHFSPGKYLRITVDGGTSSRAPRRGMGMATTRSADAGSLTLSP